MNDLAKFKHGEEGTHGACDEMIKKYGGKAKCCECTGHLCRGQSWEKDLEIIHRKFWWNNPPAPTKEKEYEEVKSFLTESLKQVQEAEQKRIIGILEKEIERYEEWFYYNESKTREPNPIRKAISEAITRIKETRS